MNEIKHAFAYYSPYYKKFHHELLLDDFNFNINQINELIYLDESNFNNNITYTYIGKLMNNTYVLIEILENNYEETFEYCYINYNKSLQDLM